MHGFESEYWQMRGRKPKSNINLILRLSKGFIYHDFQFIVLKRIPHPFPTSCWRVLQGSLKCMTPSCVNGSNSRPSKENWLHLFENVQLQDIVFSVHRNKRVYTKSAYNTWISKDIWYLVKVNTVSCMKNCTQQKKVILCFV